MKKLISVILALTLCVSMVMCVGVTAGAEDNMLSVTVDGVTTEVKVGDTFTYSYDLTGVNIKNCEVRVDYTGDHLDLVTPDFDNDEELDNWIVETFPVINSSVVYNVALSNRIMYNGTKASGSYVFDGTKTLAKFSFVAKEAGEATIKTNMIEMIDVNYEPYVDKTKTGSVLVKPYSYSEYVTYVPSEDPAEKPTEEPTEEPTQAPTEEPTSAPAEDPTEATAQKVTGIECVAYDTMVSFSWDALDGADKYWVYKYDESTDRWVTYISSTTNTATGRKLAANTEYSFKVVARVTDEQGTTVLSLDDAEVVNVTTTAPVAVSGASVEVETAYAELSWDAVDGATKYWVYKSTSPDGPFYIYNSTTTNSATVYKLKPDMTYYFKIKVLTVVNGIENYSNENDSPTMVVKTVPSSEITARVTNTTSNSVTLEWPALKNADKYWVKVSKTSSNPDSGEWQTMLSTTGTSATITKLETYTFYSVCVVARTYDKQGNSVMVNYVINPVKTTR